jgi:hypothetical protein
VFAAASKKFDDTMIVAGIFNFEMLRVGRNRKEKLMKFSDLVARAT